jgi:N-methylhydantoinase A
MAEALRRVSVERGHDPRGAALVAFGGAGGLHATGLAEALECRAVLFPRHAGLLCAIGALAGGSRRERSRSVLLDAGDASALDQSLAELERAVRDEFPAGDRARIEIERWAEARYRGQSHELALPYGERLAERFHREHRRRFGFATPDLPVEVVTLDVRGVMSAAPLPAATRWISSDAGGRRGARPENAASRGRSARVFHDGRWVRAAVWERTALAAGARFAGPAIVLEEGATLWVAPGWRARVHPGGAVVVTR